MENFDGYAHDRARRLASRFNLIIRTEDNNQLLLSLDTSEVTVDQVKAQVLKQNKLPLLYGANISDILVTLSGSPHETNLCGWDWLCNLGISENEILVFSRQATSTSATVTVNNRSAFQCDSCQQTQARFWKRWEEGVRLCDVCWKRWREAARRERSSWTAAAEPAQLRPLSSAAAPSTPTPLADSSVENFSVQTEQHFGKDIHVITADSKRYIMQREMRHFGLTQPPSSIPKTRLLGSRVRYLLEAGVVTCNGHEAINGIVILPCELTLKYIEEKLSQPTRTAQPASSSASRDAIAPHIMTTLRALSSSRTKKLKTDIQP